MRSIKDAFVYGLRKANYKDVRGQQVIEAYCRLSGNKHFGRAWGGDLTFFKNLQSNSLPTGKSFQSNANPANFPTPVCTVRSQISQGRTQERHNKNISKQNPEIFIYITLLHHQRYLFLLQLQLYVLTIIRVTLRRIQKPLGESPHFVSLNILFLVKGTKKVVFITLQ